jgi:hypothetical protein
MIITRTYASSLYPEWDYWVPRTELTPPENSTVTIMFVSALHIFYLKASADPLFPADKKVHVDGYSNPWFYKSDPKARALACIDKTEICSSDGKECWSMTDNRNGTKFPSEFWLMKLSLESSSIFDSINKRLGSALRAQERVTQFTSQPLNDKHWMDEAERLFATSLARIQFDAFNIASGEDQAHEVDGYIVQTPDEAGDLCGFFKFKSTGYTNLNYVALWCLGLPVLVLCFLLTLEIGTIAKFFSWVTTKIEQGFYSVFPSRKKKSPDEEAGRINERTTPIPAGQSRLEENGTEVPGTANASPMPAATISSSQGVDDRDGPGYVPSTRSTESSHRATDSGSTALALPGNETLTRSSLPPSNRADGVLVVHPFFGTDTGMQPLQSPSNQMDNHLAASENDGRSSRLSDHFSNGHGVEPVEIPLHAKNKLVKASAKDSDELVIEWLIRQFLVSVVLVFLAILAILVVEWIWDKVLSPLFAKCSRAWRRQT